MKLKKSDIKKLNDKLNTLEHLLKNAGFDDDFKSIFENVVLDHLDEIINEFN